MARRRHSGFTYLWLLFAVAGLGLLLAVATESWEMAARRERETELLFIGGEFARALHGYRLRTAPGQPQFPLRLEELVEDRRLAVPQRHLRKLYRDPVTGGAQWGLVKRDGRIVGVHSLSAARPLRSRFEGPFAAFAGAQRYADWVFGPELAATPAAGPLSGGAEAPGLAGAGQAPAADAPGHSDDRMAQCGEAHFLAMRQCDAVPGDVTVRNACQRAAAARFAACLRGG